MSRLHLLLPPLARFENAPSLMRWLMRGDRLDNASRGRDAALRGFFALPGAAVPVAALLREHLMHDAGEYVWLCADPAYVRAEVNGARLLACGDELGLTREEAESLAQPLRPLFGDAGVPLEITTPASWCLRQPRETQLPPFAAPETALGADLLDQLPQGDAGRRWRALFNEVQVILHAHSVNAARRGRGQMPVNALWFWGAGALPMWVKSSLTALVSNDEVACALAGRAGVMVEPATLAALDAFNSSRPRGDDRPLFDLDRFDPALIERDWLPRISNALRRGRVKDIGIAFVSGERFRIRRWHRWRVWRRP